MAMLTGIRETKQNQLDQICCSSHSEVCTLENPLMAEGKPMGVGGIDSNLMNSIRKEMVKALQRKQFSNISSSIFTSISEIEHLVSNLCDTFPSCSSICDNMQDQCSKWIVDTGATNDMVGDMKLFEHVNQLANLSL